MKCFAHAAVQADETYTNEQQAELDDNYNKDNENYAQK